ncbi:MAG: 16S rRNA (cytidine(1402)-2'-O)-methyltransferase [Patescibacteria group bacterium]|nr:16S rRNA (cytidine(1402)-2'-O)-methyltransferase [Patescibacteria group bacterium]
MSGKLYVVATPIGNLSDITGRALEVLKSVDIIACEDTRVTSKILARYEIKKELISCHQHSNEAKVQKILNALKSGKNIALVSDAGTPGLSDPGNQLIGSVSNFGIEMVIIPGPSALAAAISACHFSVQQFVFYGFLPQKKGRQTKLKEIANEKKAVIIYESVYRIKKLLDELLEFCGDSEVCICRELTKLHETTYRGKISEIKNQITEKGEFVVIIKGKDGK